MKLSLCTASAFAMLGVASAARAPLANVADVAKAFADLTAAPAATVPVAGAKRAGFTKQKDAAVPAARSAYIAGTYMVEFAPDANIPKPMSAIKNFLGKHDPNTYNDKTLTARVTIDSSLFKGQSFTVKADHDPKDLLQIPGAIRVTPVKIIKRPEAIQKPVSAVPTPANGDITPHRMTGTYEQHQAGHFGKGVKVAVIDTGVDYLHPALGGCFGKGCHVSFGKDLVGDDYNPGAGNSVTVPDDDPMDNCSSSSHGTHVSGIIGARAVNMKKPGFIPALEFVGVAPQAELGHYRVFGCDGDTGSDVMAKAVYSAFEDGADIISISIGSAGVVSDQDVEGAAIERVAKAGVQITVSAGNSGAAGLFTTGSPSVTNSAYSVASWENHAVMAPQIFDPAGNGYPYAPAAQNGGWKGDQPYEVVVADPTDNCLTKSYATAGKVLMIKWTGACGTSVLCGNAAKLNATGCLLYNMGDSGANGNAKISGAAVNVVTADAILAQVAKNPKSVFHFTDKKALADQPSANTASGFSSYGTTVDLDFKPDIAHMGGDIYSTVSRHAAQVAGNTDAYAYMSGTSMACPGFAGALALFIEQRGRLSFEKTQAYFQNHGMPTNVLGTELVESPIRAGAGVTNVTASILSTTLITPSQLALNDTKRMKSSYKISIKNTGKKSVTYALSTVASGLATGMAKGNDVPTSHVDYTAAAATVSFDKKKVTVGSGRSVDVDVKFTQPKAADASLLPFFGGYIVATPSDGASPLRVPYVGMVGDFSRAKMIAEQDPIPGARVTGILDASNSLVTEEGASLNATEGLTARLVMGQSTRVAFIDVISAGTNTLPGYTPSLGVLVSATGGAAYFRNLARNIDVAGSSFTQGGYPIKWAGEVSLAPGAELGQDPMISTLPAGTYKIRFTALKHFGKMDKASDYEVVTSPAFDLVY